MWSGRWKRGQVYDELCVIEFTKDVAYGEAALELCECVVVVMVCVPSGDNVSQLCVDGLYAKV